MKAKADVSKILPGIWKLSFHCGTTRDTHGVSHVGTLAE